MTDGRPQCFVEGGDGGSEVVSAHYRDWKVMRTLEGEGMDGDGTNPCGVSMGGSP